MPIFVDEAQNVEVARELTPMASAHIGKVGKVTIELTEELNSKLAADEKAEVESLVEHLKAAAGEKQRAAAANFPAIWREAIEFYMTEAGELERKLILGALMEALR